MNNDQQATLKKGKPVINCTERILLNELSCVDKVLIPIDQDRTVCKTIESLQPKPDIFFNGGDQFNDSIPELKTCEMLGIEVVDGLGEKIQSSSWLIKKNST